MIAYTENPSEATHVLQRLNPKLRGHKKWETAMHLKCPADATGPSVTAFLLSTKAVTERDIRRARVRVTIFSQRHALHAAGE